MAEGMFGSRETVASEGIADTGNVDSENGSNDSGVSDKPQFDEATVRKSVQERLAKQAKKHAAEKAELESRLAAYESETPNDEKPANPKQIDNVDSEVRRKLSKAEKDNKALLDRLERHRQGNLKAQVQAKLAEKDCIDPELVFGDLSAKGYVKLDEDDKIVVDPLYKDLDNLVDDYLGRRDYLKRSKNTGGIGSKAPGVTSVTNSEKDKMIAQIRSVAQPGSKLFGK